MNTMNVNNTAFTAKMQLPRIKMARNINNVELPVDNYVKEMLEQHGAKIEKAAEFVGKDVVLAQRGKTLLVNSGAKTTAIDMREMNKGEDLVTGIIHNLHINA